MSTINVNSGNPCAGVPAMPDNALTFALGDTFSNPVHIYVGTSGDVVCTPATGGSDVTVKGIAGTILPFRVKAVKAGTTATDLLAVF